MNAHFVTHHNGRSATVDDVAPLAFAGHAHFTAMQVRDRRVRGLDLHLARLHMASVELFGQALPDDRIRSFLRAALAEGPSDVSVTVTVSSSAGEFSTAGADDQLDVLVRTAAPAQGPSGPLSLAPLPHERFLPAVKHVGEVAKTYLLRQVADQGFDDAAFVDRRGRLSEASIWNLAFWDGSSVVWPDAEYLPGTTMGMLRRQLERFGVDQHDLEVTVDDVAELAGCVVMNSWTPGVEVRRLGAVTLPDAGTFVKLLHQAHRAEPWVEL